MLYILNTTKRVNNFSYSSMLAAQSLGIEFHIAGNWTGYVDHSEILADEKKYGIKIHQVDFIRSPYDPRNLKAYKQIVSIIKKEKFDIIHCNTPIGGLIGRIAGKRCSVKRIIYQAHGFHFFKGAPLKNWLIYYPIEKILAHFTDLLITINKEDYELAKRKIHAKKVCYVPGVGIDLEKIQNVQCDRNEVRKSMGVPEDCLLLLSIGELNVNKNHQVVVKALAKLNNKNVHYAVAGIGYQKKKLLSLAKDLGVENQFHLLGFRTDALKLYKVADIFVFPSYREGLSISVMEAMASSLPIICSNIRGNVDLIEHEKGGFQFIPKDELTLATQLTSLINSETKRKEMGQTNVHAIKAFSIENVLKKMEVIYKDI